MKIRYRVAALILACFLLFTIAGCGGGGSSSGSSSSAINGSAT